MTVSGFDAGVATVREAEHLIASLDLPADAVVCTHLVRDDIRPHVAVSVSGPAPDVEPGWGIARDGAATGPAQLAAGAALAADEHAQRRAGRAVRYPGVAALRGSVTVGELLEVSAIDRVVVLGGGPPSPDTVVDTRDFVRPEWRDGLLTLVVTPHGPAADRLAPFEVPNPTECCADHG